MYKLIKNDNNYFIIYNQKNYLITNPLLFKIFKYIFKKNKNNIEFLKLFDNICFHKIEDFLFVDDILLKKIYNILTNFYLNKNLTNKFEIFDKEGKVIYIPFIKDKNSLDNLILLLNKLKLEIENIK